MVNTRQTKNSLLYEEQIKNKIPPLPPTASPVIPIRSISYNPVVWNDFNVKLHKTRQQQKVNSDWAAVYSIFIQFDSLSDYVRRSSFAFEEDKDQEITDLIRFSFPIEGIERTKVSRWRKVYDLVAFVKTVTKLDHFLEAIRNLNIMINFIQEIDSDEFKNLVYDRNKKINGLIRMSFQIEGVKTETSRLRKIYNLVDIVKETIKKRNISLETFLEHIRDLNIMINYLQDVEPDLFEKLVNLVLSKIKVIILAILKQF
ncbi:10807_t:CDS:2 [Dentiscutata heterogama]|uniref:10807_t:CDS:1 n=1 Tax=Dentiscutata heterogama TaxID=1316150 RepID=A0ACA9K3I5_9GLOM|nr:10807_t:CDS:2 [Dentiscutata heterogama]